MIKLTKAGYRGLYRFDAPSFEVNLEPSWSLRRSYGNEYDVLGDGCEWWVLSGLSLVHRTATLREAREWINERVAAWCEKTLRDTREEARGRSRKPRGETR